MKRIFLIISLFLLIFSESSLSQHIISGIVIDEYNEPFYGASIILKGYPDIGTVTQINGDFTLTIDSSLVSPILCVSSIGMKTKEVPINGKSEKLIKLMYDDPKLDEIIIEATETDEVYEKNVESYISSDYVGTSPKIHSERHKINSIEAKITRNKIKSPKKTVKKEYSAPENSQLQAGLLTAGEIHDFSKWKLWQDITKNELNQWQKLWEINPGKRHCIQLQTMQSNPIVDAKVILTNTQNDTIWCAKTDNTGKAELWGKMFENKSNKNEKYNIEVFYDNQKFFITKAKEFHKKINNLKIPVTCNHPNNIDIAFVVDATGAMGDEINYLKAELNNIIQTIKDTLPKYQINLGSVFYRDKGDDYVTKHTDLSPQINKTINFIRNNNAGGGGDTPEAIDLALEEAIKNLSWHENAISRFLFLILDAPPHTNSSVKNKIKTLIKQAAQKGIRIIPITCSGIDKSTEYLMRTCALATNGTYVFLTDDSGIGNPHIKPTTDSYKTEFFNDLIVRLIVNFSQMPDCKPKTILKNVVVEKADSSLKNNLEDTNIIDKKNRITDFNWKYYPNPTSGLVTIVFEKNVSDIFICDISGKIIKKIGSPKQKKIKVNIQQFPNGIYFIRFLSDKKKTIIGELVLQHR